MTDTRLGAHVTGSAKGTGAKQGDETNRAISSFQQLSDPTVTRHDTLAAGVDQNDQVDDQVPPDMSYTTTPGH